MKLISHNFEDISKILKKNGSKWWNLFPQQIKYIEEDIHELLKYPKQYSDLKNYEIINKTNQKVNKLEKSFDGFSIILNT